MRVRVLAPYGNAAASARVRVFEWLSRAHLPESEVFQYAGSPNVSSREVLRSPMKWIAAELAVRRAAADPADVVFVHLYASPFSRGDLEAKLFESANRSVLDFDDAVQWDWRTGAPSLIKRPSCFLRAVRTADHVIAGNEFLANWAASYARNVTVIPSCVEPADYRVKSNYALGDPPRIGWIGSPSTEKYLGLIAPSLLELNRRLGAELVVISGGDRSLGLLDPIVRRIQWSPAVEADLSSLVDVGIMPLQDSLWTRGKCGYKLLQYAAAGVPAVAANVGANARIAESLGYQCALSDDQWTGMLSSLLNMSDERRMEQGTEARRVAQQRYSYAVWLEHWQKIVLGAAAKKEIVLGAGVPEKPRA